MFSCKAAVHCSIVLIVHVVMICAGKVAIPLLSYVCHAFCTKLRTGAIETPSLHPIGSKVSCTVHDYTALYNTMLLSSHSQEMIKMKQLDHRTLMYLLYFVAADILSKCFSS